MHIWIGNQHLIALLPLLRLVRLSEFPEGMSKYLALGALALLAPVAFAQSCISLASSQACSAFNASSISTDSDLVNL